MPSFHDLPQDNLNNLLERWLQPLRNPQQTARPEQHPLAPRHVGQQHPLHVQHDAMRRREAALALANAVTDLAGTVADAVAAVVDAVPPTEIARAVAWLTNLLRNGPVPEKQVQQQARIACLKSRTLKRAKRRAGVISKRIGTSHWVWMLPEG